MLKTTNLALAISALVTLGSALPARADLLDFRMFNTANYTQTKSGETLQGYSFEMDTIAQSSLNFKSSTVTFPGPGSPVSLTQSSSDPTFFNTNYGPFPTLSALHTALPFGNYTDSFTNGTVTDTATIDYIADHFQAATPQLTAASFLAIQNANPSQALTLNFNPFTADPATNDTVGTFFSIYAPNGSTVFTTFVAPNVTSVTVPAGTLKAATNYSLALDQGGRISTSPNSDGVETELGFALDDNATFTTAAPEPAFLAVFGLGIIGLILVARRLSSIRRTLCKLALSVAVMAGLANASQIQSSPITTFPTTQDTAGNKLTKPFDIGSVPDSHENLMDKTDFSPESVFSDQTEIDRGSHPVILGTGTGSGPSTPAPEPKTAVFSGLGLAAFILLGWRRIKIHRSPFFLAALGLAAALHASATSFSAVNNFSLSSNPNGSWSYRETSSPLPTAVVGSGIFTGLDYWWTNQAVPNSDSIGKNMTNRTISFQTIVLPVGYLDMGAETQSVDARLKITTAGTYNITGNFLGIDTDERSHPVEILLDGLPVYSGTIAGYGQSDGFNLKESLAAGSVLDFENETGSTWTNLSTGLAATVTPTTPTPEPTTVGLAGLGCVVVALSIRKARAFTRQ